MCENALAWTFHQFLLGRCKLVCGKVGKARDRQRVRNRPLVTGLTYLATYQLVPSRDKTGETPGLATSVNRTDSRTIFSANAAGSISSIPTLPQLIHGHCSNNDDADDDFLNGIF